MQTRDGVMYSQRGFLPFSTKTPRCCFH
uniref:Uncharacterized protein n=1 Tax=Anguilla anguilla TaxID=7936 RepID=A0A0E9VVF4_ANGAN